jgi:hypothetical protein
MWSVKSIGPLDEIAPTHRDFNELSYRVHLLNSVQTFDLTAAAAKAEAAAVAMFSLLIS